MADRRAGRIPHVKREPRSRTKTGAWRAKRSDTGRRRPKKSLLKRLLG